MTEVANKTKLMPVIGTIALIAVVLVGMSICCVYAALLQTGYFGDNIVIHQQFKTDTGHQVLIQNPGFRHHYYQDQLIITDAQQQEVVNLSLDSRPAQYDPPTYALHPHSDYIVLCIQESNEMVFLMDPMTGHTWSIHDEDESGLEWAQKAYLEMFPSGSNWQLPQKL